MPSSSLGAASATHVRRSFGIEYWRDSDARRAFEEGSNPAVLMNSYSAQEIKWTQRIPTSLSMVSASAIRLSGAMIGVRNGKTRKSDPETGEPKHFNAVTKTQPFIVDKGYSGSRLRLLMMFWSRTYQISSARRSTSLLLLTEWPCADRSFRWLEARSTGLRDRW